MQNICVSENTRSRSLTQIFCFSELAHKHIHDGRTRHDRQIRATPRRAQRARAGRGAPGGARIAAEQGRDGLTVPAVAARAGVTPSTIYRRWGDLSQLLADVAVEQLQPEQAPPDTGSFYGDLLAWLEQYFDEMSSVPGRAMLRDVLGTPGHEGAGKCDGFTRQQIEAIRERAIGRASRPPRRSRSSRAWWRRSCMACCSPTRRRAPPGCWRWFGKWRPPGAPARRESARRDSC